MAVDRGQFDLNKTLPLPPGIQEFPVKTHSAEGVSVPATPLDPSFHNRAHVPSRTSRASTFHSSNTSSTTSSRIRWPFIGRDLIVSQSSKATGDSPTDHVIPDSDEPTKFDPGNEADEENESPPTLQHPFSRVNGWSYVPNHASRDKGGTSTISQTSPHIPQSRSDGYIDHKSIPLKERAAQYYIPPYLLGKGYSTERQNRDSITESVERGRDTLERKADDKRIPSEPRKHSLEWPLPTRKRSRSPHKRLFGENGWLSRSNSAKDVDGDHSAKQVDEETRHKPGFRFWGEKAKQKPEEKPEETPQYAPPRKSTTHRDDSKGANLEAYQSTFPISIDATAQMIIYAELELLIVTQVNRYLMEQHEKARISADSVTKTVTYWRSKNRPQVLEFMFNQVTQRDLILYNISTLQFGEKYHHNNVKLNGVLSQWKALVKEMNVRTFCHPDSMVKQHVLVTRKICELVNARSEAYIALGQLEDLVKTLITNAETERQKRRMLLGTPRVVDIPPLSPIRSPTQKSRTRDPSHEDPSEA